MSGYSLCGWIKDDGGREAAGYKGEAGDCVTRAIAIATGIPYQTVYDALHEQVKSSRLKKDRKVSPRNGVKNTVFRKYLTSLGWTWVPTMQIGSGCKVHLRASELPSGRIICSVSKHVVAVINGNIHDTHDCTRGGTRCVYGYFYKAA